MKSKLVGEHHVRKFESNGKGYPGMVGFFEREDGSYYWEYIPDGSQGSHQNYVSEVFPNSDTALKDANAWLVRQARQSAG